MSDPATISPTAHYTGQVWVRNGLAPAQLSTAQGRLMFAALEPAMIASRLAGGPSLEPYLLARHRTIDARLSAAIASGQVSQVIEVACGMSPRGWRFCARHGDALTYLEADLPAMAERKRRALERIGPLGPHHRVVAIDAARPGGPGSLEDLFSTLDPEQGTAVITEGLLNYLSAPAILALWERIATGLSAFPAGLYLSDLVPGSERSRLVDLASLALGVVVRGQVGMPFADAEGVIVALRASGFAAAAFSSAGSRLAHVIEARS